MNISRALLVLSWIGVAPVAMAVPAVDGYINAGSEGYTLVAEAGFSQPLNGGQTGSSDQVGESSAYTYYNSSGTSYTFRDNRGDLINLYVASDLNNLYIAVTGPTLPFNSFNDNSLPVTNEADYDNDQGDLYIAIDTSMGLASGSLSQTNGHKSYGVKGVDFDGWTPTHVVAVQFVDNGGGGNGGANIEAVGAGSTNIVAGAPQNTDVGGFLWNATVAGGRTYDTGGDSNFAGVSGEFEFQIPWTVLGYTAGSGGPGLGQPLRMMMYTTHNDPQWDAFDSGPGYGNGVAHEQIGDTPGDVDFDTQFRPGAADGVAPGTLPGSNLIADYSASPGHFDGVDTIEEYFSVVINPVPEPGTMALLGIGLALAGFTRRLRK